MSFILPDLETSRLILKVPTLKDAPSLQKHVNNWEVVQGFLATFPWPYPDDGALSFIQDVVIPNQGKTRWCWGIFLKSNPEELIGIIELTDFKEKSWNRGFWISQEFWNQGYMSEAILPVNRYAFEVLKFDKLVFGSAVKNPASSKLKEKTGGKFLRVQAGSHLNPEWNESEVWELTKDDWLKNFSQL